MSGIFELPPEAMAELERRHQLQHMAMENSRHDENRFLSELTKDQLMMFDGFLRHSIEEPQYGAYIRGRIDGALASRFNICACGEVHETPEEFVATLTEEEPEKSPEDQGLEEASAEFDRAANLKKYNLEEVEGVLRCKSCKAPSASLEDRMLRAPGVEGCPGCRDKEKWG